MACVSSTTFGVLFNGEPTESFSCSRGIWQGCPLAPLLFILAIDGLSRLIQEAKKDRRIKGVSISRAMSITHLLFADNVMIFGEAIVREWMQYKDIFRFSLLGFWNGH